MSESNSDRIAQNISITYFCVYSLVFLVSSIYSAYEVEQQYHLIRTSKKTEKTKINKASNTETQIELNTINNEHESDAKYNKNEENEQINQKEKSCFKRTKKFIQYWLKTLWKKK
eukprot:513059_1